MIDLWRNRQHIELIGHKQSVHDLHLNNHNFLASASSDQQIGIWDLNSVRLVQMLSGHSNRVTRVRWLQSREMSELLQCEMPDAFPSSRISEMPRKLVSASLDCSVKLWDIQDTQSPEKRSWTIHTSRVNAAIPIQSIRVLTCSDDEYAKLLDIEAGIVIAEWNLNNPAYCLSVCPSGNAFAVGTKNGTIWLNDFRQPPKKGIFLAPHTSSVSALQLDPTKLVTGSVDCTARYFDLRFFGIQQPRSDIYKFVTDGPICSLEFRRNLLILGSHTGKLFIRQFFAPTELKCEDWFPSDMIEFPKVTRFCFKNWIN